MNAIATPAQVKALANLFAEYEAQGSPLVQDMKPVLAKDLGVHGATLATLVKAGLLVAKSDSCSLWGETTRKAYRFTLRGRNIARSL